MTITTQTTVRPVANCPHCAAGLRRYYSRVYTPSTGGVTHEIIHYLNEPRRFERCADQTEPRGKR